VSGLEGWCCTLGLGGLGTVSSLEGWCCRLALRGLGTVSGWKDRALSWCRLGFDCLCELVVINLGDTDTGVASLCDWAFVIWFGNT